MLLAPEIKDADSVALLLIERGILRVDAERGLVYSSRFQPNRPRGVTNSKGYLVCTLHLGKIRVQAKIHRIVWLSVHGRIPAGFVLDHINRIKDDNRIENLRLADAALNSANRRDYNGENNPACRINREVVRSIRNGHAAGRSYGQLAKDAGISKSLVAQIVRNEIWVET